MIDKLKELWYNLKKWVDSKLIALGWKKDPAKERMNRYVQEITRQKTHGLYEELVTDNSAQIAAARLEESRRRLHEKMKREEEERLRNQGN
jgi:hypothetical protein